MHHTHACTAAVDADPDAADAPAACPRAVTAGRWRATWYAFVIGDVLHHRQPYRRALRSGLSTSHGALFRVASEWKTNVGLACRRRDTHVGAFDSVSCSASAIPSVSAAPRFADVCLDVTAETSQTIQGLRVPVRTCRRVASVLSGTTSMIVRLLCSALWSGLGLRAARFRRACVARGSPRPARGSVYGRRHAA